MADPTPAGASTMRIDKYLWFARLAKTRSQAQTMAETQRLRIDGRVIERAHASVRVGDTLTFPLHGEIRVIRVAALPRRRGPADEARQCYTDMAPKATKNENVSHEAGDD